MTGFPIRRMPLAPLMERIWQVRENVTPYDAAHLALAEHIGGPLITSDAKLAAAPGVACAVDLLA